MTIRFSVYCEIGKPLYAKAPSRTVRRSLTFLHSTAIRIQIAHNVAVPATSLCINRRLYHIATGTAVKATKAEKRRALIQDLLIGVGIPILQMVTRKYSKPFDVSGLQECNAEYVVSLNCYDIIEDYGPGYTIALTPLSFILFYSWPVAIGTVSFYFCGEYPSLHFPFGAVAHRLQLGPFTRCISVNVSLGSSWRLPKVSVLAFTSAL